MAKSEPGTVVQFASGGHKMTVAGGEGGEVTVYWSRDDQVVHTTVPESALVPAPNPAAPTAGRPPSS